MCGANLGRNLAIPGRDAWGQQLALPRARSST